MKTDRLATGIGARRQRALSMVVLMVLMSTGPLLTTPVVSAHAEPSGVTWPLEGSNDTGWISLDALGAVPETCLLYTSPSPRDVEESRMPSSA